MRLRRSGLLVALHVAVTLGGAVVGVSGQAVSDDAVWLAVSWVAEEDSLRGLGSRLVVDTVNASQGVGLPARPLPEGWVREMVSVASRLGATTGKLVEALRCPTEFPAPEVLARGSYHGRLFRLGIDAVLQATPPHTMDDGTVMVEVVSWVFFNMQPERDVYAIARASREILLRQGPEGLAVVGVGVRSMSRW